MTYEPNPKGSSELVMRGKEVWAQYQRDHEVSHLRGQVAVIEPDSGGVWIDEDEMIALDRMNADGISKPVYMVRVGYDYLIVKGRPAVERRMGDLLRLLGLEEED